MLVGQIVVFADLHRHAAAWALTAVTPERPGRDNAVAFSYSLLAVDKTGEDGACHSKQSLLRRFDLDQCANCNPVI